MQYIQRMEDKVLLFVYVRRNETHYKNLTINKPASDISTSV